MAAGIPEDPIPANPIEIPGRGVVAVAVGQRPDAYAARGCAGDDGPVVGRRVPEPGADVQPGHGREDVQHVVEPGQCVEDQGTAFAVDPCRPSYGRTPR
jgi:hypothetical protein